MSLAKKRLVLVTISLGCGGAESHLVRIANSLADHYDVHIAVIRDSGSYTSLVNDNVSIHHVGSKWYNLSTLLACRLSGGRLASLINRIRADCVISFLEPVTYTAYLARPLCKHRYAHIVAIQNNLDRSLETVRGLIRRPIRQGIIKAIESSDGVVAISAGVAGNIHQRIPGTESKTQTIYNAAFQDLPKSRGPATRSASDPMRIVACGRLTPQKGFSDLLDAFRIVRERMNVRLEILGTGPLKDDLIAQAHRLGIKDNVSFAGFKSDPLVHFSHADLFVLSSWWEGFGNVIVEAMSVGTAVVSTDCPYGPSEIITHNVNGLLVPPHAPARLAEQIQRVLQDQTLRASLSQNGRERSRDFMAHVIASQYSDFIEQLT